MPLKKMEIVKGQIVNFCPYCGEPAGYEHPSSAKMNLAQLFVCTNMKCSSIFGLVTYRKMTEFKIKKAGLESYKAFDETLTLLGNDAFDPDTFNHGAMMLKRAVEALVTEELSFTDINRELFNLISMGYAVQVALEKIKGKGGDKNGKDKKP